MGESGPTQRGGSVYLPDYSVRQLTHLQIIKITRSHYQNALTATLMDSSPQTPDTDARPTDGNTPDLPVPEQSGDHLLPPRETRPSSARTRGQQSSVPHSTSLLNEKNRIVRSKSDGQNSPSDSVFLRMDEISYIREEHSERDGTNDTASVAIETDAPSSFISTLSLSGSEDTLGKKLLLKLSHKKRKKSREGDKTPEETSEQPLVKT
ncbi:metal transporter CNNM1-like [Oncorhynchus kisutch]|uniref:metal transporter CNNM1-like n=1 Tax=Oncorhynchus kisutch TaxID=8019 RepID=UPI0012DF9D9C|nr:metal transporter CNNM1-like [Oncorhynchus kisutch]